MSHVEALDRRFVWRPYTSSEDHQNRADPVIVGGEGATLFAEDGKRYIDASGSWWTNNLGYGHPRLRAALHRQVDIMAHCSMGGATHAPAAQLAERLISVAPSDETRRLERVFYSDNGSTSVEVGLKMALQYWQQNGRPKRTRFLALPGAYHGDTVGAMSVGGVAEFVAAFRSMLFQVNDAPHPRNPADWERAVDGLIQTLRDDADEIAAVIVEPIVQGAAGMRMYAPEILGRLRQACDEADTFLIADEVFTGLGRTGPMWACQHAGIAPDILCTAKGLSGGMLPFAATLATGRVYDGFRGDTSRALLHGHTFFGNPLGAALALEVLTVYDDEDVLDVARPKAERIRRVFDGLRELEGTHGARSCGMVAAIDLGDPSGETGYHDRRGWQVAQSALKSGVMLRPLGQTLYIVPPLNISSDELDRLLDVVDTSIRAHL